MSVHYHREKRFDRSRLEEDRVLYGGLSSFRYIAPTYTERLAMIADEIGDMVERMKPGDSFTLTCNAARGPYDALFTMQIESEADLSDPRGE